MNCYQINKSTCTSSTSIHVLEGSASSRRAWATLRKGTDSCSLTLQHTHVIKYLNQGALNSMSTLFCVWSVPELSAETLKDVMPGLLSMPRTTMGTQEQPTAVSKATFMVARSAWRQIGHCFGSLSNTTWAHFAQYPPCPQGMNT